MLVVVVAFVLIRVPDRSEVLADARSADVPALAAITISALAAIAVAPSATVATGTITAAAPVSPETRNAWAMVL